MTMKMVILLLKFVSSSGGIKINVCFVVHLSERFGQKLPRSECECASWYDCIRQYYFVPGKYDTSQPVFGRFFS